LRARRAEQILSDTDLAIPAAAWGFRSPAHFSDAFRRLTGLSPSEYRQRFRLR